MGTLKTKEILVDVARKLFAEKGIEGTTMNDIALASKRGRRTLYTYFKNKEEIYYSVIESELNQVANKLSIFTTNNDRPDKKLIDYIYTRMEAIREVVDRNGNLKADFFLDISNVERVRRRLDHKEKIIIRSILKEGCELGIFKVKSTSFAAQMIHYALKGYEVPYIKGELSSQMDTHRGDIFNFITKGLTA